jgi:hypothetical protein
VVNPDLSLTYDMMELSADIGLAILAYSAEPGSRSQDGFKLIGSSAVRLVARGYMCLACYAVCYTGRDRRTYRIASARSAAGQSREVLSRGLLETR